MKCILIGRYNAVNIGDLAISDSIYNVVSKYYEVDKYNLFGNPYKFKNINQAVENDKLFLIRMKIYYFLKNIHLDWVLKVYSKSKNKFKSKINNSKCNFEDIVKNYDLVIIAGGNMIFELTPGSKSIDRFNRYVQGSKDNNIPILALDIGIGPFHNESQAIEAVEVLNGCDAITFRDKSSYEIYKNYKGDLRKAFISIDPVFLMSNKRSGIIGKKITIGINILDSRLIGFSNKEYKETIKGYVKLVDNLTNNFNFDVSLFTTTKEDELALIDVSKEISNKIRVQTHNIEGVKHLLDLYNGLTLLIGTRMHSMIIAYTQLVPLIGLSWQQKIDAMFNTIDEEEFVFEFKSLNDNIDAIIKKCIIRIENIENDQNKIKSTLKLIKSKADIDRKILENYVKKEYFIDLEVDTD